MKLGRVPTPKRRLVTVPSLFDHLPLESVTLVADSTDYAARMTEPWGMLGNDEYGCCVFAARAHHAQCASVNTLGKARQFSTEQVLDWYSRQTGFDRNDPTTDNGAIPLDAIKWFKSIGEVVAYARVDHTNHAHVAAAIELFGGLYTGWDLPLAWQTSDTWSAGPSLVGKWAPGSWGGHMMSQTGYDSKQTPTVTWGRLQSITWSGWVYCSEAYALITQEWLDSKGKTAQGFDLDGLTKRLSEVD